jgi:hypothetical protein
MARATTVKSAKTFGRATSVSPSAKYVVVPATTGKVLKAHGHTLKSATNLKAKLDRQLAHAGGK